MKESTAELVRARRTTWLALIVRPSRIAAAEWPTRDGVTMGSAYNGEEALKAELRALTPATRQLREEVHAEIAAPKTDVARARLRLHASNCAASLTGIIRSEVNAHSRPEALRAKSRDIRAQATRKLMKARSTRERVARFLRTKSPPEEPR